MGNFIKVKSKKLKDIPPLKLFTPDQLEEKITYYDTLIDNKTMNIFHVSVIVKDICNTAEQALKLFTGIKENFARLIVEDAQKNKEISQNSSDLAGHENKYFARANSLKLLYADEEYIRISNLISDLYRNNFRGFAFVKYLREIEAIRSLEQYMKVRDDSVVKVRNIGKIYYVLSKHKSNLDSKNIGEIRQTKGIDLSSFMDDMEIIEENFMDQPTSV